jgi:hypothetical protein
MLKGKFIALENAYNKKTDLTRVITFSFQIEKLRTDKQYNPPNNMTLEEYRHKYRSSKCKTFRRKQL